MTIQKIVDEWCCKGGKSGYLLDAEILVLKLVLKKSLSEFVEKEKKKSKENVLGLVRIPKSLMNELSMKTIESAVDLALIDYRDRLLGTDEEMATPTPRNYRIDWKTLNIKKAK